MVRTIRLRLFSFLSVLIEFSKLRFSTLQDTMLEPWNDSSILPPPVHTAACATDIGTNAGGEFVVLHSPNSLHFSEAPVTLLSSLKEIFAASLGLSVDETTDWNGLSVLSPFATTEAVVEVFVNGISHLSIALSNLTRYHLTIDAYDPDMYKALKRRIERNAFNGSGSNIVQINLNDGEDVDSHLFGHIKLPDFPGEYKYLSPSVYEDQEFLIELEVLKAITAKINAGAILPDDKIDFYEFKSMAFKIMSDHYGPNHPQTREAKYLLGIKGLSHTCENIVRILSKQSPLHKEAAIFSRFLYKFDKKFRNDIGYRKFKKVNTALKKYLKLNLLKDVENFILALPASDDDELYLPTRQMLEYLLVRIMTFSKIMQRICICSKQTSVFYLDRIKRGESHWMSLMPYAILSRVWSMSTVLLNHSCSWYKSLHPYLNKLELKGLNFLPPNYTLPGDLEEWLDMSNLDSFGKFEWTRNKRLEFNTGILEDDDDGDKFENILDYVKQLNNNEEEDRKISMEESKMETKLEKLKSEEITIPLAKNVDQGQAVSRETFQKQGFQSKPQQPLHAVHRVTNKDSLQKFITREEDYRNQCSKLSLTSHLSFMQWQCLKTALMKLLESLSNNRKIERKFQIIWKEKCTDYA